MTTPADQEALAHQLARDVLILSRNTLLVSLRFLDAAVSQLRLQPLDDIPTYATDGQHLLYNPWHVLHTYREQKENPIRDMLHILFHCLFHHPFVNHAVHQGCWDLACDIAAEIAINDLNLGIVESARAKKQKTTISHLQAALKLCTAEKIYRYYLDQNLDDAMISMLRTVFYADDHTIWYQPPEEKRRRVRGKSQPGERKGDATSEPGEGEGNADLVSLSPEALQDLWERITRRAQVDIETTSRQHGNQKGGLQQNLNQINREKYNYASFLQRFSVLGEVMQINDDEFEPIFYTYGLRLYHNLPLIEPLEYKEVKRVKEFVIAIDTSGSVQGKVVQAFIQKTYNLLKQTENFFTRINIHIIQCDTAIQQDIKLTTTEEMEQYIKTMTLHGFGGTDFRPVFDYVDKLIVEHEFENLRGLIYFTHVYCVYPTRKPAYDTAFVFLDEDYLETPTVPTWAIKLILSSDDVMEKTQ